MKDPEPAYGHGLSDEVFKSLYWLIWTRHHMNQMSKLRGGVSGCFPDCWFCKKQKEAEPHGTQS